MRTNMLSKIDAMKKREWLRPNLILIIPAKAFTVPVAVSLVAKPTIHII